tara:strand:- start:2405 stop:2515 length:111 start_codon:yes stop_codon:yes gene_type:complete
MQLAGGETAWANHKAINVWLRKKGRIQFTFGLTVNQ